MSHAVSAGMATSPIAGKWDGLPDVGTTCLRNRVAPALSPPPTPLVPADMAPATRLKST